MPGGALNLLVMCPIETHVDYRIGVQRNDIVQSRPFAPIHQVGASGGVPEVIALDLAAEIVPIVEEYMTACARIVVEPPELSIVIVDARRGGQVVVFVNDRRDARGVVRLWEQLQIGGGNGVDGVAGV